MLIWRMVALNCGSLTSAFVLFIISVLFWNAPVTLTIAANVSTAQRHWYSHNWCCSCICTLPSRALLEMSRSRCLFARTISRAIMRALLTSFFFASCLSSPRVFCIALSSCLLVTQQRMGHAQPALCRSSHSTPPGPAAATPFAAAPAIRGPSPLAWGRTASG